MATNRPPPNIHSQIHQNWSEMHPFDLYMPNSTAPKEDSGVKREYFDGCDSEISLFRKFVDNAIVSYIVEQINTFAEYRIWINMPAKKRSLFSKWKPISNNEFLSFLAVFYNMGMYPWPQYKNYWKTDTSSRQAWFSKVMSRERFESIMFSMLHVADVNKNTKSKIERFFKMIVTKFQEAYYPDTGIAVDESGV